MLPAAVPAGCPCCPHATGVALLTAGSGAGPVRGLPPADRDDLVHRRPLHRRCGGCGGGRQRGRDRVVAEQRRAALRGGRPPRAGLDGRRRFRGRSLRCGSRSLGADSADGGVAGSRSGVGSTTGGMPVDICWTTGCSAAGPVGPDAGASPVLGPMAAGRASGPLAGSICTTGPASGGSGTRCCGGRVSGAPRPRRRGPASGDRWTTGPGGVGSGAPRPRRRGAAGPSGATDPVASRLTVGVTVGHGGDLAGNLEHGRVGEERCPLRGVRQARRRGRERPGVRHLGDRERQS